MRAIIRFSIDGEQDGALRNNLANILTAAQFALNPNVTATWEAAGITALDLSRTMRAFWHTAETHQGPGHIDHVWTYCDNPPDFE